MSSFGGRVLVTGGAGFIGTALCRRFAADASQWLFAYDSLLPQVHGDAPELALPDGWNWSSATSAIVRGWPPW